MKANKILWRISVATTLEAEDAVAELLGAILGRPASSHFNVETQVSVVSVFGPQKTILARPVREQAAAGLKRIKSCGLNIGAGKIKTARVRREDWSESWKRHFKAIEIKGGHGARPARPRDRVAAAETRGQAVRAPLMSLLIKPSWIKKRPRPNQAVVILDPGLSFGTGQHATTSFCLHEIVRFKNGERARPGCSSTRPAANFLTGGRGVRQHARGRAGAPSFLDIGTGSGILAIAAAKLGYQPVRAFDFDPEAVRVAQANANVNGVTDKIELTRDDATRLPLRPARQYDLVCANLISSLLIAERRRIVAQVKRSGTLVLAGILRSEFAQVQTAFEESGLKLAAGKNEKEWRSGSFCFTAK